MIFQIIEGTHTRQLFINSGRLVYRKGKRFGPTLTLELDVQANDPQYTMVKIGLTGVVEFVKREYDAKSE